VTPVAGEARVAELSRMLAGIVDSAHARSHAAELLQHAGDRRAAARATTTKAAR
jgi:DNA repair ATPase RecN